MRPFKAYDAVIGSPTLGTSDTNDPCIHSSINRPAQAPAAHSTSVSVSTCVATRIRPAPSANRMPNSLCLVGQQNAGSDNLNGDLRCFALVSVTTFTIRP
jgi:hypothetical protein